jgi:hypothetical protein
LLPAERALVEMGEAAARTRVPDVVSVATAQRFIDAVEQILKRTIYSFASATDPERGVVMEIFVFEPETSPDGDGSLQVN